MTIYIRLLHLLVLLDLRQHSKPQVQVDKKKKVAACVPLKRISHCRHYSACRVVVGEAAGAVLLVDKSHLQLFDLR